MTKPTLSIITPTRNRSKYLEKHLESLKEQITSKDEIIIIDNNSTDNTSEIINKYDTILPLKTYHAPLGTTYGKLYNLGIYKSTKDIVVFFDDDCIADINFVSSLIHAHQTNPNTLIQGMTYSRPKNNIYTEIMGDHYQNWIKSNIMPDGIHMKTFDNKNASLPRKLLSKKLLFDESLQYGSEDIELGFRFVLSGIPIRLESTVVAYHHERTTVNGFLRQHLRIAKAEGMIDRTKKYHLIGIQSLKKMSLTFKSAMKREYSYLLSGNIKNFITLPFIYILLVLIRLWGYNREKTSK
jgi:glycosyltransferase involved in cell wall biosynthesis